MQHQKTAFSDGMDPSQRRSWRRSAAVVAVLALSAALLTSVAAVRVVRGQQTVVHEDTTPPRLRKLNLDGSLPVVLWHGMGDSCCAPYSIGKVASYISEELGAQCEAPACASVCLHAGAHVAAYCALLADANDSTCTKPVRTQNPC